MWCVQTSFFLRWLHQYLDFPSIRTHLSFLQDLRSGDQFPAHSSGYSSPFKGDAENTLVYINLQMKQWHWGWEIVLKEKDHAENLLFHFSLWLKFPTLGLSCRKSWTSLTTGWQKSLSTRKFCQNRHISETSKQLLSASNINMSGFWGWYRLGPFKKPFNIGKTYESLKKTF